MSGLRIPGSEEDHFTASATPQQHGARRTVFSRLASSTVMSASRLQAGLSVQACIGKTCAATMPQPCGTRTQVWHRRPMGISPSG
jgi:hypothetical protein